MTRRDLLGAAVVAGPVLVAAEARAAERKRMAIVCTEWRPRSHAQHMGDRFLVGYPKDAAWRKPELDVVSVYVDQHPESDLSRIREKEFGFKIYPTIAETLRCGGSRLAVDAVLIIGEHGRYPRTEYGQVQYPRYQFFKQVSDVFRQDGKVTPVFNDKHLSWNWDWAAEMVGIARQLKIPFMAGSSLPHTWRMPALDIPDGAEVEEVLGVAEGGVDSYDFHALEMMQTLIERRQGGETGVAWVDAARGDAVWKRQDAGGWTDGGWGASLFEACLSRSQTLEQPRASQGFNHRYPTPAEIRTLVKAPVAYRYQHRDGVKATMLLMNGLVNDFTVAVKLKGRDKPLATLFYLPPLPNVQYSAMLMSRVEELFLSGKATLPIERTLLTTGLVAACVRSLHEGKRLDTSHLDVRYRAPKRSRYGEG